VTQNFVPLGAGFSLNEGVKKGYSLKRTAVTGSLSVKNGAVADRYRHAVYHNTDDLDRP